MEQIEQAVNDYYFYIMWRDIKDASHKVGILARIEGNYYMKPYVQKSEDGTSIYDNGFSGVPTFSEDKLYKSERRLFDFFERRLLHRERVDSYDQLKEGKGRSVTDSYSVEEMSKEEAEKFKDILLELDRIQTENQPTVVKTPEN